MTTNRIGGDYNAEALEAFRAAYADQIQTPEEMDVESTSGMPTNVVSNTSPWLQHTGLWTYPSGVGPDQEKKKPFNPQDYMPKVDEEEEEMTEEELESLLSQIEGEEEEFLNSLLNDDEEGNFMNPPYDPLGGDEEDEDLMRQIDELLGEDENEEEEEEEEG